MKVIDKKQKNVAIPNRRQCITRSKLTQCVFITALFFIQTSLCFARTNNAVDDSKVLLVWALITGMFFCAKIIIRKWKLIQLYSMYTRSKIRSAAQGYIFIQGNVKPYKNELISPLSKEPCCWYAYVIEKYSGRSRGGNYWKIVQQSTSHDWFIIQDETGECVIVPTGADISAPERKRWYGSEIPNVSLQELFNHNKQALAQSQGDTVADKTPLPPAVPIDEAAAEHLNPGPAFSLADYKGQLTPDPVTKRKLLIDDPNFSLADYKGEGLKKETPRSDDPYADLPSFQSLSQAFEEKHVEDTKWLAPLGDRYRFTEYLITSGSHLSVVGMFQTLSAKTRDILTLDHRLHLDANARTKLSLFWQLWRSHKLEELVLNHNATQTINLISCLNSNGQRFMIFPTPDQFSVNNELLHVVMAIVIFIVCMILILVLIF